MCNCCKLEKTQQFATPFEDDIYRQLEEWSKPAISQKIFLVNLHANFVVSSFNRSRDIEGVPECEK